MRGGDKINNNVADFCIAQAVSRKEIQNIIGFCDEALEFPILQRKEADLLIDKLYTLSCFLYAYNKKILGYIAFYANDRETHNAFVILLAVREEEQNRKIGTRLLNESIEISKTKNMETISLEVQKNNDNAIRFYRLKGFNEVVCETDKSIFLRKKL